MQLTDREYIHDQVMRILQQVPLADRIEVLGNLMIQWGVGVILKDHPELQPENGPLDPEEIIELVAIDKRNGETLGGALAHQGLLMLMWLQSGESNEYTNHRGTSTAA